MIKIAQLHLPQLSPPLTFSLGQPSSVAPGVWTQFWQNWSLFPRPPPLLPLSVCTPGPAETSSTPCLRSRPSTGPVCLVSRPLPCPHLHYSLSSSLPPSGPPYSMYPFLSSIVYLFILQDFFCLVLSKIAFTPFFPLSASCPFTAPSIHLPFPIYWNQCHCSFFFFAHFHGVSAFLTLIVRLLCRTKL